MTAKGVTKEEIPTEVPFKSQQDTYNSKRHFGVYGFAWFRCPRGCRTWASGQSRCVLDLKEMIICHRTAGECHGCDSEVMPQFTEESVAKMAKYAVENHKCRIQRESTSEQGNLSLPFNFSFKITPESSKQLATCIESSINSQCLINIICTKASKPCIVGISIMVFDARSTTIPPYYACQISKES